MNDAPEGAPYMSEQSPQSAATAPKKPWYMKWWVWLIAAVLVIGGIGQALGLGGEEPDATTSTAPTPAEEATTAPEPQETESAATAGAFDERFASVCAAVTSAFESTGTVTCNDATTWQANHDANPERFPYEDRDINVDINGEVAVEVKAVADSSTLDHFRAEYTCDNLFGGEGSCVVGEAGQDALFSVIIYGAQDDARASELAASVKQAIESVQ